MEITLYSGSGSKKKKIIEEGEINVDVHYYEDSNTSFQLNKKYTNDPNNNQPIVDVTKKNGKQILLMIYINNSRIWIKDNSKD